MGDKSNATHSLNKTRTIYGKSYLDFDPVLEQSRRDDLSLAKSKTAHDQPTKVLDESKIEPSLSIRVGLHSPPHTETELGVKYVVPKNRKQRRAQAARRKQQEKALGFCQYDLMRMPSPASANVLDVKLQAPSAEIKEAKVVPHKPSVSPSDLYPPPPKKKDLKLKKPKSGVFINETAGKKTRKKKPRGKISRKSPRTSGGDLLDITTSGQIPPTTIEEMMAQELAVIEEMGEDENEEKVIVETFLTKMFRKRVSQISKTTSINSKELRMEEVTSQELEEETVSRIIQKFRRDSEQDRFEPGSMNNISEIAL